MPLSENIKEDILKLFKSKNIDAILPYLKKLLEEKNITLVDAIKYAKKAVELSKNSGSPKQHLCKYFLFQALRNNKQWVEAITVLIEYLQFNLSNNASEDFAKKRAGGIQFLNKRIKALEADLEEVSEDILLQLQPMLDCNLSTMEFLSLKQKAYFLKAKCHETLDENSKA